MWRRNVHVVANAEIQLFKELGRRCLTRGLRTQYGFVFDFEKDLVYGTTVDFYWPALLYAVFLDGDRVHGKFHQARKDELITTALQGRGVFVDRFQYRAPISNKALNVIADAIEKRINMLALKP